MGADQDNRASGPSWKERQGRVSQAFDEWWLVEQDLRAFLRLGLEFAENEYNRLWQESSEEPAHEDSPELIDVFEAKVSNLHQTEFNWILLAAVLREAVSSFEVYLEKAREEVLRHHSQPIAVAERSPNWRELEAFFGQLGITIRSSDVDNVVKLRNFLTHRRGELRTEKERTEFQQTRPGELPPLEVELTREEVEAAMDTLATAVRAIDRAVYEYTWGSLRVPSLTP
jgi:hypothetical protein